MRRSAGLIFLGIVGGISALGVLVMVWIGKLLPRSVAVPVHGVGTAAIVNGDTPKVWIVEDTAVLGGFGLPGREILSFYQRNKSAPPLGYVRTVDDLPHEVDTIVLPGRAAEDYLSRLSAPGTPPCHAPRILFLSPSIGPDAVPAELLAKSDVRWRAGSFVAVRAADAYGEARDWVSIRAGCELYIPNWLEEAFSWR